MYDIPKDTILIKKDELERLKMRDAKCDYLEKLSNELYVELMKLKDGIRKQGHTKKTIQ